MTNSTPWQLRGRARLAVELVDEQRQL